MIIKDVGDENYKSSRTGPIHLALPTGKSSTLSYLAQGKTKASLKQWLSWHSKRSVDAEMVSSANNNGTTVPSVQKKHSNLSEQAT